MREDRARNLSRRVFWRSAVLLPFDDAPIAFAASKRLTIQNFSRFISTYFRLGQLPLP